MLSHKEWADPQLCNQCNQKCSIYGREEVCNAKGKLGISRKLLEKHKTLLFQLFEWIMPMALIEVDILNGFAGNYSFRVNKTELLFPQLQLPSVATLQMWYRGGIDDDSDDTASTSLWNTRPWQWIVPFYCFSRLKKAQQSQDETTHTQSIVLLNAWAATKGQQQLLDSLWIRLPKFWQIILLRVYRDVYWEIVFNMMTSFEMESEVDDARYKRDESRRWNWDIMQMLIEFAGDESYQEDMFYCGRLLDSQHVLQEMKSIALTSHPTHRTSAFRVNPEVLNGWILYFVNHRFFLSLSVLFERQNYKKIKIKIKRMYKYGPTFVNGMKDIWLKKNASIETFFQSSLGDLTKGKKKNK
ncbi:hypothetical protein RFI_37012 [Reticulomyxa filosa]|uniref:Uncharacterized protein n=1 Tax=Reticulomyxa filosa TaxID=46433 RepID=X6LH52_RETFI|nr:hypothetical protein RFI_37012 [Reticulomyxa filosa]|eukprot:ETO00432.1 hypothetical protein RFI_37012 [Reticulomyxa filosa]